MLETTLMVNAVETEAGPGLATVIEALPVCVALPVAVSWVDEMKFVCNGALFHRTCAPLINRLPLTVIVNAPGGNVAGVTEVMRGIRLRTVTAEVAEAVGSATLVALTVTV